MPIPRFSRRTLAAIHALVASAALAAGPAAAQRLVFAPLEWGAPADSVRPRMEAAGWRFLHANPHGDVWMTNDQATVTAVSSPGGLVHVLVEYPAGAAGAAARHSALVDSLRRELGAPTGTSDGWTFWQSGFAMLGTRTVNASGGDAARVEAWYRGPGAEQEELRRRGLTEVADPFPALEEGWGVLRLAPDMRVAVDTATVSERSPGTYRARIRLDYAALQEDPSGSYDAIVYGSDVDCPGRRAQLRSRTALRQGRQVRTDSGATVWLPARPNSREAFMVEIVCGYVADRAARAP